MVTRNIFVEVKNNKWKQIKYCQNWNDLIIKHNWVLVGVKDNCVLMSRDGYINRFKEVLE